MKEGEQVVDALIVREGENSSFLTYILFTEITRILDEGGLSCAEKVNLRETKERIIPESVKKGETIIRDILVRMEPCVEYGLN